MSMSLNYIKVEITIIILSIEIIIKIIYIYIQVRIPLNKLCKDSLLSARTAILCLIISKKYLVSRRMDKENGY